MMERIVIDSRIECDKNVMGCGALRRRWRWTCAVAGLLSSRTAHEEQRRHREIRSQRRHPNLRPSPHSFKKAMKIAQLLFIFNLRYLPPAAHTLTSSTALCGSGLVYACVY